MKLDAFAASSSILYLHFVPRALETPLHTGLCGSMLCFGSRGEFCHVMRILYFISRRLFICLIWREKRALYMGQSGVLESVVVVAGWLDYLLPGGYAKSRRSTYIQVNKSETIQVDRVG